MKRFLDDIKKYQSYAIYSAKANLKSEVASSYLNWMWWVLDPLCFMMIYTLIFGVVFNSKEPFFSIFIFIGITVWDFFNKTVMQSVRAVKSNKAIVSKVYLPKYVLTMVKMYVNGFKSLISVGIIVLMMIFFQVPLSWNLLYVPLLLLELFLLTFGISSIVLHFGVFVEDLSNVMTILLRLTFYMTGIFYDVFNRIPAPYNEIVLYGNPLAFILTSMRDALLYQTPTNMIAYGIWLVISMILAMIGVNLIYKNENSYVKVI